MARGKRRWNLSLVLAGIGIALALMAATFYYYVWWVPNEKLRDKTFDRLASPAEKRSVAHRILFCPWGDKHDAYVLLINSGNVDSVPYLLRGLEKDENNKACTGAHCLEALRKITGHDAGERYADWQRWWDEVGSSIPPDQFPIRRKN